MITLHEASEVLVQRLVLLSSQWMVDIFVVVIIIIIVIDDSVDDGLRAIRRKEISQRASILSV